MKQHPHWAERPHISCLCLVCLAFWTPGCMSSLVDSWCAQTCVETPTQMGWLRGLSVVIAHPAVVTAAEPVVVQQRGAVAAPRMRRRGVCDKVHWCWPVLEKMCNCSLTVGRELRESRLFAGAHHTSRMGLVLLLGRRWTFHVNQGAPTKDALLPSHSMILLGLAVVWAVGRGCGPGLGVSISQEQHPPACCFDWLRFQSHVYRGGCTWLACSTWVVHAARVAHYVGPQLLMPILAVVCWRCHSLLCDCGC